MPFTSISEILLGPETTDDDRKQRVATAQRFLSRAFPNGVIAVCKTCNAVREFTVKEAATLLAKREWPRCHDRSMMMDDPDHAPQF